MLCSTFGEGRGNVFRTNGIEEGVWKSWRCLIREVGFWERLYVSAVDIDVMEQRDTVLFFMGLRMRRCQAL